MLGRPVSARSDTHGLRATRGWRLLNVLFWSAVAVSVVHYTDNYFNYDAFPQPDSAIPDPSKTVIGAAWFVFTAAGLTGYFLYRTRYRLAAAGCLAFYSISGLVGFGHYLAPEMTDAVWWRQAHVVADIALGIAMLSFAMWSARLALRERQVDATA